jgi:hypothetical protein
VDADLRRHRPVRLCAELADGGAVLLQFFWRLLSSIAYVAGGALLAATPVAGVSALTGISGLAARDPERSAGTITASGLRPMEGWGWFLFDAACALLLGVMILAQWHLLVMMSGISRIFIAGKIRTGATHVERLAHGHA